ncbi:MAG: hypothetical protein RLZZ227_336 [Pseudomonadota bacterium]
MRLDNKLARWQEAGLLQAEQRSAILAYEQQHALGWQGGLAVLGVLAIVIGVLAIIAANWQIMPPWLKLGAHLLLNTLLALGVLRQWQRPVVAQLCLLAWYGLTLTCIGLMGQVFHLAGSTAGALLLWTLLSSAAVIAVGNSKLVLLPWALGTLVTLFFVYAEYLSPRLGSDLLLPWLLFGAMLPAIFAMLAARLPRPQWQPLNQQALWLAGLLPILTAGIVCQLWYFDEARAVVAAPSVLVATLAVAALAVALVCNSRIAVPEWLDSVGNFRLLLLGACVLITLPFLWSGIESEWIAAFSFISLWLLLGWLGHRTRSQRLVSLAIGIIALRIFIIYLEVFGSLLQTGFGLIFSGALLLGLLAFARTLSRKVNVAQGDGSDTGEQP